MAAPAAPAERADAGQRASAFGGLFGAAFDALRTRLDLVAVELEIHLLSLLHALVWLIAAVACTLLGLAFAVTALIVALWDTHRVLGLLCGTLTFIVLAGVCGALGARTLRRQPPVLKGSLQQLREDQRRAGGTS